MRQPRAAARHMQYFCSAETPYCEAMMPTALAKVLRCMSSLYAMSFRLQAVYLSQSISCAMTTTTLCY
ncbi:hypothetical protein PR003_g15646 [Phytophthora rubi]|uniref:Uncharacterized protein n=1 Tax=Phytophthora rubi TaxID=129364 RepID=A0A6A4ET01_9STRA|nr:hypothetical protein PR002_g15482 [Phytophthora rubi]KAE9015568.1 hypothetical protein PR001_g14872 [Phytophthora rubi]KAE9329073.1 hypothetical protein PR003_g15646 [Phytophthora rubi]